MTIAPRNSFRRVTVRIPDTDLMTTRLRGVGYRQVCEICEKHVYADTVRDLRREMHEHRLTHAAGTTGEDTSPARGTEA